MIGLGLSLYLGAHMVAILGDSLLGWCGAAVSIQRARMNLSKMAEALTPAQVQVVLEAWAKSEGQSGVQAGTIYDGAWVAFRDGTTIQVRKGQVNVSSQVASQTMTEVIAKKVRETLEAAGGAVVDRQIAQALAGLGKVSQKTVTVDNEGVSQTATQFVINI